MRGSAACAGLALVIAAAVGCAQTPKPLPATKGLPPAQLEEIRAGFDTRVREAFEAKIAKPLKPAPMRPPVSPGHGNFARPWSYSLMEYAAPCFVLNRHVAEANAAIIEDVQHYLGTRYDIIDPDSFYWHSEVFGFLIEQYGRRGSVAPGRLTPEAEDKCMEALWIYCKQSKDVVTPEYQKCGTWDLYLSENHHAQAITTFWYYAKLAKDNPAFRDRKYDDGSTAAEQYAAWTEYLKVYCLERARKGLLTEEGSDGYTIVLLKGFYNVYEFAEDPELKRRVGCFLDLLWAMWAQEQIDGIRGGGRIRIYQTGNDRMGVSEMSKLMWFYFGVGKPQGYTSALLTAMMSTWRPSPIVNDLACDLEGRGRYEVNFRSPGRARVDGYEPPMYLVKPEGPGIHGYTYVTPGFIMGTLMVEPRPMPDWVCVSSQNRWHGVIFAGHPDARIFPQSRAFNALVPELTDRCNYNQHWSVQSKGTLIVQKLQTSEDAAEMRIWFSKPGLTNRVEENGWVFVEAPKAYAAVRVARGGAKWRAETRRINHGEWLVCEDEWTPVITEAACKEDFADYAAFRKAVAALPVEVTVSLYSHRTLCLKYQGLSGDKFVFWTDYRHPPTVNGVPVEYDLKAACDSPFIHADYDSGVVTLSKGGRTEVLDFNRP